MSRPARTTYKMNLVAGLAVNPSLILSNSLQDMQLAGHKYKILPNYVHTLIRRRVPHIHAQSHLTLAYERLLDTRLGKE